MTAERLYRIHCDHGGCPDWIMPRPLNWAGLRPALTPTTAANARKIARRDGWSTRDGKDFCPRHRPARRTP